MKKGIFLLVTLLSFSSLIANNTNTVNNNIGVDYRFDDAITFTERGVQFHVFLDGGFDFTTTNNRNLGIRYDNFGRIRQVGNTVINYNFNDNVTAIGNVSVRYRFGQLSSVGNLDIRYDSWGYPHFVGFVKDNRFANNGFNVNINIGNICNYDDVFFYNRNFRTNYRQFREDNNFFYYRALPNARIGNRSTIIKRRKPNRTFVASNNRYLKNTRNNSVVRTTNRNNTVRNANTTRNVVKSNNRNTKTNNNRNNVKSNNKNTNTRTTNNNRNNLRSNNKNINTKTTNNNRNNVKSNIRNTNTRTINNNRNTNNRVVKTTRTAVKTKGNTTVKTTKTVTKNNNKNSKNTSSKRSSR